MNRTRSQNSPPDEPACSLPGVVTAITSQQRRTSRVNVWVAEQFCFACRATIASDFGVRVGTEISEQLRADVLREDAFQSAYEQAIELLGYRARTEREIRSRLLQRKYEEDAIERVVQRLIENSYLDDAVFARFWIENRTAHRPRGERAIRQELAAKGVNTSIIIDALAEAELDQCALAIEAARKRLSSLTGLPADVQRRRLAGFLQRRGFGWDAIGPALQVLLGEQIEGDPGDES